MDTFLAPLTSDTYNWSVTVIDYTSADKSVESMEFVEFHSSVTLSEQYAILGKVAQEVGKIYQKSGDENLVQLAQGYRTMKKEAKHLSRLVRTRFLEYDREILNSSAVLMDASVWSCLSSILTCLTIIATMQSIIAQCYLCAQVVTCVPACFGVFSIPWCVGCILAGIVGCLVCASAIVGFPLNCYHAGQCLGLW